MQSPEQCCEATDSMFTLPGEETGPEMVRASKFMYGFIPSAQPVEGSHSGCTTVGWVVVQARKAGGWLLFLNGLLTHSATPVGTLRAWAVRTVSWLSLCELVPLGPSTLVFRACSGISVPGGITCVKQEQGVPD